MPLYDYWCYGKEPGDEHELTKIARMNHASPTIMCPEHLTWASRRFSTQRANTNDQFRSYYLSSKGDKAAEAQGRRVTGPRDKQEARAMGAALGRVYVGDDYEKLSEKGQRAISKTFAHNEKGAT